MSDAEETIEALLASLVAELAVARQETVMARAETVLSQKETTAALVQVEHLEQALKSARVIGMAMGILINRHKVSEGAAFQMLANGSQRQNRKLRDIADRLVETGELPD